MNNNAHDQEGSPDKRPPTLQEIEQAVQTQTIDREQETISCIEELLQGYFHGFNRLRRVQPKYEETREYVWLLLSFRTTHSLRWAFHLLLCGYYSQSFALVRMGYEDWLTCFDCLDHPETVEALLARKKPANFSDMARRLPEDLRKWWGQSGDDDSLYGALSTFSHPRWRSLMVILNPRTKMLRLAPEYDEVYFLWVASELIQVLVRMSEFVTRLLHPVDQTWVMNDFKARVDRGNAALGDIDERGKRLEGPSPE